MILKIIKFFEFYNYIFRVYDDIMAGTAPLTYQSSKINITIPYNKGKYYKYY